jgi:methionyl-tRNA synthetase
VQQKTGMDSAETTLGLASNLCRSIAILSAPFIPDTAERIFTQLGIDDNVHALSWTAALDTHAITGKSLSSNIEPLVTKIESEYLEELQKQFAGTQEK